MKTADNSARAGNGGGSGGVAVPTPVRTAVATAPAWPVRAAPHRKGWRFLVLCGCLALLLPRSAAAAPLSISCPEMTPLTLVSVLVMKEAYDAIGQPFVLVRYTVPSSLSAASRGAVDGALHRIAGIERLAPDLRRVLVPINMTEVMAMTARPEIQIGDWYSLTAFRIGVQRGFVLYERQTAGMDVIRLDRLDQLIAMLDRGRLDVVVADRLDLMAALRAPAYRDLPASLTQLDTAPLYHYLHKRHEALVPQLRVALEKMQRSGRIRAIRMDVAARLERGDPLPALPVPLQPAPAS
ncbi:MAG: transporter substrate-binding protein [Moraxellaceae bacterium]|jgi:polar amino acid transport system substrate-binding protein|nr:transporter substrate-binding protein [Moraxellaceae bacterium]